MEMDKHEARLLLENLRQRIEKNSLGHFALIGKLTKSELAALEYAINFLTDDAGPAAPQAATEKNRSTDESVAETGTSLDLSVLDLPPAPDSDLLCLDFGTALSKAAIGHAADVEDMQVLDIGIAGDQEQISATKLVSAVYIDNKGVLWFGNKANENAMLEIQEGGDRAIINNIKRYLSEGEIEGIVGPRMNPTDCAVTNRDLILAYLAFFTWCVSDCLAAKDIARNIKRRFAIPCLQGPRRNEMIILLKELIGEAQVLADTYGDRFINGIELNDFLCTARNLGRAKSIFPFVDQEIVEPLAVTGALMSWEKDAKALLLVIDIGAGTSDFGLFSVRYNSTRRTSSVESIKQGYDVLRRAGNFIDQLLMSYALKESGFDKSHPMYKNQVSAFKLNVRDYKETLFTEGSVSIALRTGDVVTINRDSFLALKQIQDFATDIQETVIGLLERVDESHLRGAFLGQLAVKITGGGASLPFFQNLIDKTILIGRTNVKFVKVAIDFPKWLSASSPHLEDDFPQLAVAIGGARLAQLSYQGEIAVASGTSAPIQIGGYYTKGN
jgi:hypothetical protein